MTFTTNSGTDSWNPLTTQLRSWLLKQSGLIVTQEVGVPVWFRGEKIGQYFADMVVENIVLVELKAVRTLDPAHEAQLLHYLRATEIEVGLLMNFGLKPQFRRLLFDNPRKNIRAKHVQFVAQVSA